MDAQTTEMLLTIDQLAIDAIPTKLRCIFYKGLECLFNECQRHLQNDTQPIQASMKFPRMTDAQLAMYRNIALKCTEVREYLRETTQETDLQLIQHFAPGK